MTNKHPKFCPYCGDDDIVEGSWGMHCEICDMWFRVMQHCDYNLTQTQLAVAGLLTCEWCKQQPSVCMPQEIKQPLCIECALKFLEDRKECKQEGCQQKEEK